MSVADTTVKHYLSVMSGAPALSTNAGECINVIDACISGFGSVTLSSLTLVNNIATGIVSNGHGFVMRGLTGPVIQISGATPSSLNGVWRVAAVSSVNVFTFVTEGISDVTASGTITAKIAPYPLTKVYSGTYKAAYKFNALTSNGLFLRVDDTNNYYTTFTMYETMSDVDTGTGASAVRYLQRYYTASYWCLFGDDVLFYIVNIGLGYAWSCAFGDQIKLLSTDIFNTALGGASSSALATGGAHTLNGTTYQIARSYTQLGSAVSGTPIGYRAWAYTAGAITYPNPAGNQAIFSEIDLFESNTLRCKQVGIVHCLHAHSNFTALQSLDLPDRTILVLKNPTSDGVFCQISGPWR